MPCQAPWWKVPIFHPIPPRLLSDSPWYAPSHSPSLYCSDPAGKMARCQELLWWELIIFTISLTSFLSIPSSSPVKESRYLVRNVRNTLGCFFGSRPILFTWDMRNWNGKMKMEKWKKLTWFILQTVTEGKWTSSSGPVVSSMEMTGFCWENESYFWTVILDSQYIVSMQPKATHETHETPTTYANHDVYTIYATHTILEVYATYATRFHFLRWLNRLFHYAHNGKSVHQSKSKSRALIRFATYPLKFNEELCWFIKGIDNTEHCQLIKQLLAP